MQIVKLIPKQEVQFQFTVTGYRAYEHKAPFIKKVTFLHVPCRWMGEQS
jgi:hypothetical protein